MSRINEPSSCHLLIDGRLVPETHKSHVALFIYRNQDSSYFVSHGLKMSLFLLKVDAMTEFGSDTNDIN